MSEPGQSPVLDAYTGVRQVYGEVRDPSVETGLWRPVGVVVERRSQNHTTGDILDQGGSMTSKYCTCRHSIWSNSSAMHILCPSFHSDCI